MMVGTVVEVLRIVVIVVMSPMDMTRVGNVINWVMGLSINMQITVVNVCLRHRMMKQIQVLDVVITEFV